MKIVLAVVAALVLMAVGGLAAWLSLGSLGEEESPTPTGARSIVEHADDEDEVEP